MLKYTVSFVLLQNREVEAPFLLCDFYYKRCSIIWMINYTCYSIYSILRHMATKVDAKDGKFQRGELMKKVLLVIGTGLVIGAVFTMPGILFALKPFFGTKKSSSQALRKTYEALVRKKFVSVRKEKGKYILETTETGKKQQKEYQVGDVKIPVPRVWNGTWRMIVFDIPESKKPAREALRNTLEYLDCYRFQDSVYIHPFECENEIDFVTEIFGVQKYVYCFVIEMKKVPPSIAYHFAKLLSEYSL